MAKRPQPDAFVRKVLTLLTPLGDVRARAMFGGHGLYLDGVMFALIADDRLYFKTDDASRDRFAAAGGEAFTYVTDRRTVVMSYWAPPAGAMTKPGALLPWARLGAAAARHAATKRTATKAGRRPRRPVI